MTTIHKSALVPYSAQEMYALVADISSYSAFLPWCGGARILSDQNGIVLAAIDISFKGINKTFTTRNRGVPGEHLEMTLVEGPFSQLHGRWEFTQLEAQASKISLHLGFEFSSTLLALTVGPVFGGMANTMVDSFRQRAEQVYGRR